MKEIKIGQIVKSLAGHDKGKIFIIKTIKDEYVYLIDGKNRKTDNPKKKKIKHIQITNKIIETNLNNDADIRQAIKLYME